MLQANSFHVFKNLAQFKKAAAVITHNEHVITEWKIARAQRLQT